MAKFATSYLIEKARILAGEGRKTYGHFCQLVEAGFNEAQRNDRSYTPHQATLAELLGVSINTITNWMRRAYSEGRIRAIEQTIQLEDGRWMQIANRYIIALTAKLRRRFKAIWEAAQAAGVDAAIAAGHAGKSLLHAAAAGVKAARRTLKGLSRKKPAGDRGGTPKSAANGGKPCPQLFGEHRKSPTEDNLFEPAGEAIERPKRVGWACRGCPTKTENAWFADRCHRCKAERPYVHIEGELA